MLGARLSRRAVLLCTFMIAADLLIARDGLPRPRKAAVNPAEAIRDRAVAASRHLVALYAATVAQHPQLRARLAPLAAEHQAHLEALTGEPAAQQLPLPTHEAQATLTPAPGEPTPSTTPQATVPRSPTAALAALAGAERAAADGRLRDLPAAPPELARLLASIAACQAVHAELLDGHDASGEA